MGGRTGNGHDVGMDETTPLSRSPGPSLRRSRTNRKVAGVCGGLGAQLGIDPLVLRITVTVLAVFGGAGVLLYGLAWLLVPDDGAEESEAEQLLHGRAGGSAVAAIVVVVVGLAVFGGFVGNGLDPGAVVVLAVIGVGAALAVRQTRDGGTIGRTVEGVPAGAAPPPPPPGAYGQTAGTAYSSAYAPPGSAGPPGWAQPPSTQPSSAQPPPPQPPQPQPPPPPPPAAPREHSPLGALTVSAALIMAGLLAAWGVWDDGSGLDLGVIAAAMLLVTGIGLVVGAWRGRARGLIGLGLATLLVLVPAAVVDLDRLEWNGAGERRWAPQTVAEIASPYELGAGSARLDLTELDLSDIDLSELGPGAARVVPVRASVRLGELVVTVPDDVTLDIDAEAGIGEVRLPDELAGDPGAGTLELYLDVGLGEVVVRRA